MLECILEDEALQILLLPVDKKARVVLIIVSASKTASKACRCGRCRAEDDRRSRSHEEDTKTTIRNKELVFALAYSRL